VSRLAFFLEIEMLKASRTLAKGRIGDKLKSGMAPFSIAAPHDK
jgi:hypothetical protein